MYRFFKNNKGAALPLMVLLMVILVILGITLATVSISDAKHAVSYEKRKQANYIARAGAESGNILLKKRLTTHGDSYLNIEDPNQRLTQLTQDLNNQVNSGGTNFDFSGIGTFTIKYEFINPNKLKIISKGTESPSNAKETVTVTLPINSIDDFMNPSEWIAGNNIHNAASSTGNKYVGNKVRLKRTKSPQAPSADTVLRGSVIMFNEESNVSLTVEANSFVFILDADVVKFKGKLIIEKHNTHPSNDGKVILRMSDDVAGEHGNVGFEEYNFYHSYIKKYYDNDYTTEISGYHSGYGFISGYRYGIVHFAKGVDIYDIPDEILEGYYFYPDGVMLHDPTDRIKLIPINSNHPIVKAIDNLLEVYPEMESSIWNNE